MSTSPRAQHAHPERSHLHYTFVSGYELVDGTARLAAMNLLLHGIGTADGASLIELRDALIADPSKRWSVVLSNPPFGAQVDVDDYRCRRPRSPRGRRDRATGLRRHHEQQTAQLSAAHHDDPRHQRPCGRCPARQRALRARCWRNSEAKAVGRLRPSHDTATSNRRLSTPKA
jgi:hypothetical protein